MKFPNAIPVKKLAEKIDAGLVGDKTLKATGINEVHHVQEGDVTFVDVKKYFNKALHSAATIILINEEVKCPDGKALLICDDPFEAYNRLVLEYRPVVALSHTIAPTATIHPTSIVEPGAVVGHHVSIGRDCHIEANVTIAEHTLIGDHVIIQSGTVIGTEAFYFKRTTAGYQKWRSGGRVVIEDHVQIGAGCTINKGVSSDTIIGAGTKIDCQVHIGHDVVVGKNCLFAAQVGIAGNVTIGDWVILYGQVGVAQNVKIGDKAILLAKSGVGKDMEGGKTYFGAPASEVRAKYREMAALRHLPEFFQNYYK